MYKIELYNNFEKDIKKLPQNEVLKILKKIKDLSNDPRPHGCKRLLGNLSDLYRIRIGNYRIIYEIHDSILLILIVKVGNRADIYT